MREKQKQAKEKQDKDAARQPETLSPVKRREAETQPEAGEAVLSEARKNPAEDLLHKNDPAEKESAKQQGRSRRAIRPNRPKA